MADYPNLLKTWVTKADGEVVWAEHVNTLQGELLGVEEALGVDITRTKDGTQIYYPSHGNRPANIPEAYLFTTFSGVETNFRWPTLDDRITNIERAALRNMDGAYVSCLGGSVVDPTLNGFRLPTSGGVMIKMAKTDLAPALSIQETGHWGDYPTIALYSTGQITAKQVFLYGTKEDGTSSSGVQLDGNGGSQSVKVGSLTIDGLGNISSGLNIYRIAPQANQGYQSLRVSNVPGADTIRVDGSTGGGRRGVLRVVNGTGATVFLLDSDGNVTCKNLIVSGDITDADKSLELDGVTLDKNGLVFWAGGAYRPASWVLKNGGAFDGTTLEFTGGHKITTHNTTSPKNLTFTAPMTLASGGFMASGMTTAMYEVSGLLAIPVPEYTGTANDGKWDYPYNKDTAGKQKRRIFIPFDGPPTGAVEIIFSAEVRSYSRPTWVSYSVYDQTDNKYIREVSTAWSVLNNGARAEDNQSDVDQMRGANPNILTGLLIGHRYELRILTRAATPGPSDKEWKWVYAFGVRVLIRPVMTKVVTDVIEGTLV